MALLGGCRMLYECAASMATTIHSLPSLRAKAAAASSPEEAEPAGPPPVPDDTDAEELNLAGGPH